MFDERGRGFILKGKRAQTETRGRHPYMTEADAYELVKGALKAYRDHHKHPPARVIILKTSRFRSEEADGILRALNEAETEYRDLVWVQESYDAKILRDGDYPVLRGTFVDLNGKGLLYTNGSIPYYGTYPGLYVPRPLLLCPHPSSDSTVAQIAEEVFSLTKINWNSTQMNQRLPVPIRAARKVGEVLKYMSDGQVVSRIIGSTSNGYGLEAIRSDWRAGRPHERLRHSQYLAQGQRALRPNDNRGAAPEGDLKHSPVEERDASSTGMPDA